jgi:predicted adenylyl cyclase CyaB
MDEIEVKILEVDQAAIEEKLISLGAIKCFEGDIQALLFDFPDRRLDQADSFIRIRSKGDEVELAFKRRILGDDTVKRYEETEVTVSDKAVMADILLKLGLVNTVVGRKKHRISYATEGAHFELDTFDGMPTFLEIETADKRLLEEWVARLGYRMEDTKPWGGRQVYEHYGVPYILSS